MAIERLATNAQADLIAVQLRHTIDLLKAEMQRTNAELMHYKELSEQRLNELETCKRDHEERLRRLQESATQFKVLAGLSTGGGLLSLIALLRLLTGLP
jgi:uncharacterized membrane protein YdbT with pleckstrin-like domain